LSVSIRSDRTDTGDRVESISTTADDVQAIVKMQNLAEISAGDCVALHTGLAKGIRGAMIATSR
jgi:hypothetical protein